MIIDLLKIQKDLLGAVILIAALIAAAVIVKLIASAAARAGRHDAGGEKSIRESVVQAPSNVAAGAGLTLIDVDEKTAALIMAIISHESGIPLSELIFRRIKLV